MAQSRCGAAVRTCPEVQESCDIGEGDIGESDIGEGDIGPSCGGVCLT